MSSSHVGDIVASFAFSTQDIRITAAQILQQLKAGRIDATLPFQHPSYVTTIPNGTETGRFLSVDLGGTNCRICLVELHGDGTFSVEQQKHTVPHNLSVNSRHEPLFDWVATQIGLFLQTQNHTLTLLPLGFTFSFTCTQTSLADGALLHWDKGWDIPSALGQNPCAMLQTAVDAQNLPVRVAALANDSVGALLARAYSAGVGQATTLASVIVGTGTNAAYVEHSHGGVMAINTEWGCMDDDMRVLPRTPFDDMVDSKSTDRGCQMLEKRVSGLYLGELLRLAVVELYQGGNIFDFRVDAGAAVFRSKSVDASLLSALASDSPMASKITLLASSLGANSVSETDVRIVQRLAAAIVSRAAGIVGAATAAIVLQSGLLESTNYLKRSLHRLVELFTSCFGIRCKHISPIIDIGITGSVIEHHPTFLREMHAALCQALGIGKAGGKRIRLTECRDASAVGAALTVHAAMAQERVFSSNRSSKNDV